MQAIADACDAGDHPALVDEWSHVRADPRRSRHALAAQRVGGGELLGSLGDALDILNQRDVPDEPSGLLIERDHAGVHRDLVHLAVGHGDPAIGRAATHR